MTLACAGLDYYDISLINGINMAISMTPLNASANGSSVDPDYYCKAPGSTLPQACDVVARARRPYVTTHACTGHQSGQHVAL